MINKLTLEQENFLRFCVRKSVEYRKGGLIANALIFEQAVETQIRLVAYNSPHLLEEIEQLYQQALEEYDL